MVHVPGLVRSCSSVKSQISVDRKFSDMVGEGRERVIENARVLTADYLPNKMVHREGERQEIARNLRPILDGDQPLDMLIYGRPGTGKTAMSRHVVKELQENVFVNSCYVNCFSEKSRFEVFYELLDKKAKVPRDGTSTEKVVEMFEEKVRNNPTVIIIDEIGQISNEEILFDLSRFINAAVICIANEGSIFGHFSDKIQSRFSGLKKLHFKRYEVDELVDILKLRAEHGLKSGAVSRGQLETIAKRANGDARVAVQTLRLAAQEAENKGLESITEEIIEESVSEAHETDMLESLEMLNRHQKSLYKILREKGDLKMSDLYKEYKESVEDQKSKRTIRRYLKKMVSYNVIAEQGKKSGRTYGVAS